MSDITDDNRRRLLAAIESIFGTRIPVSKSRLLANSYIDRRLDDPDPDGFDQRMNLYLKAMEKVLIQPTGRADGRALQVQTIDIMLTVIERFDFVAFRPATSTIQ